MMIRWLMLLALPVALLVGQPAGLPAPVPAGHEQAKDGNKGPRCQARTKAGKQCSRKAVPGSQFCWQHGGKKKSS
ncbi:MAG: hypothetical protein IANPNBLG_02335 [Bryobacteraceae bacterium]|nr:hypothetical protein [Bryobacteraceae bacterium]